jgi:hypothetical protein
VSPSPNLRQRVIGLRLGCPQHLACLGVQAIDGARYIGGKISLSAEDHNIVHDKRTIRDRPVHLRLPKEFAVTADSVEVALGVAGEDGIADHCRSAGDHAQGRELPLYLQIAHIAGA